VSQGVLRLHRQPRQGPRGTAQRWPVGRVSETFVKKSIKIGATCPIRSKAIDAIRREARYCACEVLAAAPGCGESAMNTPGASELLEVAAIGAHAIEGGTPSGFDWAAVVELAELLQVNNAHILTLIHHLAAERWRCIQPNPAGWLRSAVLNDVRRTNMKALRDMRRMVPLEERYAI
jgi:hypothetical protein